MNDAMEPRVRPISPEDAQAFTGYFGDLDFGHAPHWATCFCRYYFFGGTAEEWQVRPGGANRAEAEREIAAGRMKGYLAFDGGTCVGWCNANALDSLVRLKDLETRYAEGRRLGCTICFVVHPAYRGQGLARRMLRQAVEDFRRDGFDGMLAAPFDAQDAPQKRYRGTKRMYEELGYEAVATDGPVTVMRLRFR